MLYWMAPMSCASVCEHGGSVAKLPLGGKIRKCCIENSMVCVDQLSCFRWFATEPPSPTSQGVMYRRKDMAIDHYSTATAMLAALRRRAISSTELVDMHIARIEAYDGTLNA